jgi:ApbE superfamily uncharacterized protein (UPF0280 family)
VTELFRRVFEVQESRGIIISDKKTGLTTAVDSIKRNRKALETYAQNRKLFLESLKPVAIPAEPLVAKMMAEAAEKADVGPMAAVAGVLADLAVADMVADGCKVAVVEDGGEISAVSDEPVDVAVGMGDTPLSNRFGFRLTEFPVGLATSSGVFSHALSFGDAEVATIFCDNAGLADAAATAVCNVVKSENAKEAIQIGLGKALAIQGVQGAMIIYKGFVGTAGEIPQIIKIENQCENNAGKRL